MEGDTFKETEEQCVHPFRMSIAVLEKQNILCNIFKEMCETLTYISHVKKSWLYCILCETLTASQDNKMASKMQDYSFNLQCNNC